MLSRSHVLSVMLAVLTLTRVCGCPDVRPKSSPASTRWASSSFTMWRTPLSGFAFRSRRICRLRPRPPFLRHERASAPAVRLVLSSKESKSRQTKTLL
jgi:hypothetical protein